MKESWVYKLKYHYQIHRILLLLLEFSNFDFLGFLYLGNLPSFPLSSSRYYTHVWSSWISPQHLSTNIHNLKINSSPKLGKWVQLNPLPPCWHQDDTWEPVSYKPFWAAVEWKKERHPIHHKETPSCLLSFGESSAFVFLSSSSTSKNWHFQVSNHKKGRKKTKEMRNCRHGNIPRWVVEIKAILGMGKNLRREVKGRWKKGIQSCLRFFVFLPKIPIFNLWFFKICHYILCNTY